MRETTSSRNHDEHHAPIGVFDSGVGGLTVLRELCIALPGESFVYLGDTARLPYGTKSPASIQRYSLQAAGQLLERGVKCLVVACNTASALALRALTDEFSPVPVIGVLEPGAAAACRVTRSKRIAVIATESTVRGGAYEQAIRRRLPAARVDSRACAVFVALSEEGWTEGPVVEAVIERYLGDLRGHGDGPEDVDTVLLGCTHFPVLAPAISSALGPAIRIVDSAATTAAVLVETLTRRRLLRTPGDAVGSLQLLATDGAERFARVGSPFLGQPIAAADVEIVDLQGAGKAR
jgi:glutamate racemase